MVFSKFAGYGREEKPLNLLFFSKKITSSFNFCPRFRSKLINNATRMIDEKEIKDLCNQDLRRGIRLLMDRYQEPLYGYVRRLLVTHEDAQDALQETFVRVYRSWDSFRGDSALSTWLYRIATNEALRILEARKREAHLTDEGMQEDLIARLMATDYVDYDDGMAVKFQAAVLSLPEKQRLVFNFRYYDELSYEEIAGILGTKVETLKVNYHYAKEKIKDYILNH